MTCQFFNKNKLSIIIHMELPYMLQLLKSELPTEYLIRQPAQRLAKVLMFKRKLQLMSRVQKNNFPFKPEAQE